MHLGQKMSQVQILAPRMIQSMEILQLPIMALEERIQQELQENPVLELREAEPGAEGEEAGPAVAVQDEPDPGERELVIDSQNNELDFDRLEALNRDWENSFNEEHRPSRSGLDEEGDRKHDAMQNMASRPQALQEYLNDQIAYLDVTPEQAKLMRHVIAHIADTGYLGYLDEKDEFHPFTLEEVARTYSEPVTAEQVEEALTFVQKLDPPGVGARNLRECLLLQITPETPHRELLRVLIQNHLEDIHHNRLPIIQKKTGFDLHVIKDAIEALRHLNPKPGAQFDAEHVPHVVPDIKVERNDQGGYDVRLLDDWLPNISINRKYIEMYREKGADPKTREYLKRKIQAATWLQDSIAQRRSTLEKVTRAIIQHQRAFLDKGAEHIEPLKMQQIADQVGVHVTTVSRAVDDKYVETPRGVFALKRFFGGGTHTASGEEVAWEVIKQKLLEIVEKEDKSNPLSDEDLMKRLHEAGYTTLARRTVTKYRKMLNIPSSRQRKDWTAVSNGRPEEAPDAPPVEPSRHEEAPAQETSAAELPQEEVQAVAAPTAEQ
jgi:RNA polymerase sigma-54 factor